jgi:hypothetical protein
LAQAHLLVVLGLVHPLALVRLMVKVKVEVVEAESHQAVEDYLEVVYFLVKVNFQLVLVLLRHYQQGL